MGSILDLLTHFPGGRGRGGLALSDIDSAFHFACSLKKVYVRGKIYNFCKRMTKFYYLTNFANIRSLQMINDINGRNFLNDKVSA